MSDIKIVKDIDIIDASSSAELITNLLSQVAASIDIYFDSNCKPILGPGGMLDRIGGLHDDKISIKIITNVTEQNISSYERNKNIEVRHIDGIGGNFIIIDERIFISFLKYGNENYKILIISKDDFVRSQLHMFLLAWGVSSTLSERRKQIIQTSGEFTRNIDNSYRIIEKLKDSIESANEEIFLLCSNSNAVFILEQEGILTLLQNASTRRVSVKMIVHVEDNDTRDRVKSLFKEKFPNILLQSMRKKLQTKIMSMVIDKREFISIHTNDNVTAQPKDFIQSCTYSNNQLKLNSAISLLESLWIQSGFDNQNIIKQAYFQMFKGFNFKEEDYRREWSFDKRKEKKKKTGHK